MALHRYLAGVSVPLPLLDGVPEPASQPTTKLKSKPKTKPAPTPNLAQSSIDGISCPECGGSGLQPGTIRPCDTCEGVGRITAACADAVAATNSQAEVTK